jgi:hypothetical protein
MNAMRIFTQRGRDTAFLKAGKLDRMNRIDRIDRMADPRKVAG